MGHATRVLGHFASKIGHSITYRERKANHLTSGEQLLAFQSPLFALLEGKSISLSPYVSPPYAHVPTIVPTTLHIQHVTVCELYS